MPYRVLIDLNVVVDALNKREPFFEMSAGVLAAAETGRIEDYTAAHTVFIPQDYRPYLLRTKYI